MVGGGHDVKWHYGDHPGIRNSEASKAVSGSIVFTSGGARTYSLAASVVYDSPVENLQIDRAHPDGASRISFVDKDLVFHAAGKVVSWDIFTGRAGTMRMQVYRPEQAGVHTYPCRVYAAPCQCAGAPARCGRSHTFPVECIHCSMQLR